MNKNNNSNSNIKKPLPRHEYERLSSMADISLSVIEKTLKFFMVTMHEEVSKSDKAYLISEDVPGYMYTTASVFPLRVLDHLEQSGLFPQLNDDDIKTDLMEKSITKQMALVAQLKERKNYV